MTIEGGGEDPGGGGSAMAASVRAREILDSMKARRDCLSHALACSRSDVGSNTQAQTAATRVVLKPRAHMPPLFSESESITHQLNESLREKRDRLSRISAASGGGNFENGSSGGYHHKHRHMTHSPHSQLTVSTEDSATTGSTTVSPDRWGCRRLNDEDDYNRTPPSSSSDEENSTSPTTGTIPVAPPPPTLEDISEAFEQDVQECSVVSQKQEAANDSEDEIDELPKLTGRLPQTEEDMGPGLMGISKHVSFDEDDSRRGNKHFSSLMPCASYDSAMPFSGDHRSSFSPWKDLNATPSLPGRSEDPDSVSEEVNTFEDFAVIFPSFEYHREILDAREMMEEPDDQESEKSSKKKKPFNKQYALLLAIQETVEDLTKLYTHVRASRSEDVRSPVTVEDDDEEISISDESSYDVTDTDDTNTSGWISQEDGSRLDSVLYYNSELDSLTDASTPSPVNDNKVVDEMLNTVVETNKSYQVTSPMPMLAEETEEADSTPEDSGGKDLKDDRYSALSVTSRTANKLCFAQGGSRQIALKSGFSWDTPIIVHAKPVYRSVDYLYLAAETKCFATGGMYNVALRSGFEIPSEPMRPRLKLPRLSNGEKRWKLKARGGQYHLAVWMMLSQNPVPRPLLHCNKTDFMIKTNTRRPKATTFHMMSEERSDRVCGARGTLFLANQGMVSVEES